MMVVSERPYRNFYGRIKGKTLRKRQLSYLKEDLARVLLDLVSWDDNPKRMPLDLGAIFECTDIWLEIGFGGGEHLMFQALRNPDVGIIGAEPYLNGVAMLLGKVRSQPVENMRIYPGDVRDVMDVLPAGSIARAFLLYPDPWPKKRHHRRRFVTPEYLQPLARVMRIGAVLCVATDIPDYVRQTLEEIPRAGFEWCAERPDDWRTSWDDWVSTRYEQKALRNHRVPHYLSFVRV